MSKQSTTLRMQILRHLASGDVLSGEELGETFGISRAAVANHIQQLEELGVDVFRIKAKGYRLASPITPLDESEMAKHLDGQSEVLIEVFDSLPSTNTFVKEKVSELAPGYVCFAEAQTAGRGRRGRDWIAPLGTSLAFTTYWPFDEGYQAMSGLSLAVGVAITDAFTELGMSDAQLKWPNDIYLDGRKLGGVLIEVEGQPDSTCHAIIGVGLNISLPESIDGITQPYTDLKDTALSSLSRNHIAGVLVKRLRNALKEFASEGLAPFSERWDSRNVFSQQPITLLLGDKEIRGVNVGIDENGAILLETEEGTKAYHGGEISVRAQ